MRGRRSGLKHTEFFLILIAIYLLVGETGLCDRVEECTPVEGGQLLDLMGSRFVLFEDVMQAPGFKTVTRWTEEVSHPSLSPSHFPCLSPGLHRSCFVCTAA